MFENRDYIALSVSDDSVRKKSLKRVSFEENSFKSTSENSYLLRVHSSSIRSNGTSYQGFRRTS